MTTGAAVCRGRSLADEFGEDALIAAARSCLSAPSAEIKQVIMERADAFAAGAPQHDDMTLVIAQVG
jgi:sigma-B regulation protein RsbU (phosphoserine phosphatase)